jgi:hypothetical protein
MDARKFLKGATFLGVADVSEGPLRAIVDRVEEGRYGKLNLIFPDLSALSINSTNNRELIRAFGPNTDDWLGHTIEMYAGMVFGGKEQDAVLVRPVDVPKVTVSAPPLIKPEDPEKNTDIPF